MKNPSKIAFVISSLTAGGAERIISQLANYAADKRHSSTLIILSKRPRFYGLRSSVSVHEPSFTIDQMSRIHFQWKIYWWLRSKLNEINADAVLTFGGKYNGFVLLAAWGLGKSVFISDRSRPTISYGKMLDILNPIIYRRATGIIAQTRKALEVHKRKVGHRNIEVIPNPISLPKHIFPVKDRHRQIINVGRFIRSKHQDWLLQYFEELNVTGWKLIFLGDGMRYHEICKLIELSPVKDQIQLLGTVNDIEKYYQRAAIFAFTSTSEGFPNALGEAMAYGCACIAFDCEAGPSDLIDDGINGFLIPVGHHEEYKTKLQLLINDPDLRNRFGKAAHEKMKQFSVDKITQQYLDFMLDEND